MYDSKEWSWGGRIQERDRRSHRCWLRWLVLFLLVALASIPAAAQCTAYVPTHKSNSVAVIDTVLDRVVTTIPVQIQPLAVAITPNGAFAYVTNSGWIFGSNSVSVISTTSNSVVSVDNENATTFGSTARAS